MTARRPLLAVAVVLALAGCAGTEAPAASTPTTAGSATADSSAAGSTSAVPAANSPAGRRVAVQIAGGQTSGDTGRVAVPLGTQVTLVVTSDVAGEVHVHGYDLSAPLTPGTAELTFDATVPGVFEVELHEAGTVLLSLQVG
jgi:hypothetical protein